MGQRPIAIEDMVTQRTPTNLCMSPDGSQVVFSLGWISKSGEHPFADIWLASVDGSSIKRLTGGESHDHSPRWSPGGRVIAFISDRAKAGVGSLYLLPVDGGEARRILTTDAPLSDPRWLPDGKRIAVKATDPDTEEDERRKEARDDVIVHGEREKLSRLQVVSIPDDLFGATDLPAAEPVNLIEGDWHVWEHVWSPSGEQVAATVSRRLGWDEWFDSVRLALIPAAGGRPLFVGGEDGVYQNAFSITWSPDGARLAFLGRFDPRADNGFAVYLADAAHPDAVQLRYKDDHGTPLSIGWRSDDELVILRLCGVHTTIYSLSVSAGEPEIAVTGSPGRQGTVESAFSGVDGANLNDVVDQSGRRFAAVWSDSAHPPEVWAGDFGDEPRQLTNFNRELLERALGRMELLRWQSDEHEIEGLLIYPVDYEPGTRYPTILHIHGGPAWAWDDHFYANWHDWGQLLAGQGYAVLLPNPRGSTGRGWRFQFANYDDVMGGEYRDSQAGLDMLIERGIADPERLGIGGWSYGGYTTAWALTQTDRFKAAVMGAGISNYVSDVGTSDAVRWLDAAIEARLFEDPDAFWHCSPMRYVGNVSTPTLVLHGDRDERVPVSQGWEFYNALRMMGVPARMVVYPREPHPILEREHQRDLLERTVDWFDRYLKEGPGTN